MASRIDRVLTAGLHRSRFAASVPTKQPLSTEASLLQEVHDLTAEIQMKRMATTQPEGSEESTGPQDLEAQRLQSYFVVAQEGQPVLHVIRGWFLRDNRFIFDAMVRAAGLPTDISKGGKYDLNCSSPRVPFENMISAFNLLRVEAASYVRQYTAGDRPDAETIFFPDTQNSLRLLRVMPHLAKQYGPDASKWTTYFADAFKSNLLYYASKEKPGAAAAASQAVPTYKHPHLRSGVTTEMAKVRVPARPDSMVFFAGPHEVSDEPVRRLCAYVHSITDVDARKLLTDYAVPRGSKPSYTEAVAKMLIPPHAQGKPRSPLIDKFLKEKYGAWGWTRELNPAMPEVLRQSLLIDEDSITNAPMADPENPAVMEEIKTSMKENSYFVKYDVLADFVADPNVPELFRSVTSKVFEEWILNCLLVVVNAGVAEHERLKSEMRNLIAVRPEILAPVANAIEPFEVGIKDGNEPRHHEKLFKERLNAVPAMSQELKDFAMNVLLRNQRTSATKSWTGVAYEDELRPWITAYAGTAGRNPYTNRQGKPEPKKIILAPEEATKILAPAPEGTVPIGLNSPLLLKQGDTTPENYSLWSLAENLGGTAHHVQYRKMLYDQGLIPHPHVGCWVSALKPWPPSLVDPVARFDNFYQTLKTGTPTPSLEDQIHAHTGTLQVALPFLMRLS